MSAMKPIEDIVVLCWDYGTFLSLAEMFGQKCRKAYYYSPFEDEFRDIKKCCIGEGLEFVQRINEPFTPEILDEVDLHVFPDIGFGGVQKFLRSLGKAVWGSNGADRLELSRTDFLDMLKELELPMIKSIPITGLTALEDHLKKVKNVWVKINRFRSNMETWKHIDFEHSHRKLEALAVDFGGMQEDVKFVVQDEIESDVEIGYDGWCIDGQYPESSFQGYEQKNKLYLGSLLEYKDLPEQVQFVNDKISNILREYKYRNFMATEIRIADDIPYFIDPTFRMPGQTGEHLLTTCENLPDVMWHGANGIMLPPIWKAKFALEATMHYKGDCEAWKILNVPKAVEDMVKLYHYCMKDGMYHFPTRKNDEVGVICGIGDTIEEAHQNLMDNFEEIKDEPVYIDSEEFVDLIKEIQEAEEHGIEFTEQEIPSPEIVLNSK